MIFSLNHWSWLYFSVWRWLFPWITGLGYFSLSEDDCFLESLVLVIFLCLNVIVSLDHWSWRYFSVWMWLFLWITGLGDISLSECDCFFGSLVLGDISLSECDCFFGSLVLVIFLCLKVIVSLDHWSWRYFSVGRLFWWTQQSCSHFPLTTGTDGWSVLNSMMHCNRNIRGINSGKQTDRWTIG